MKILRLSTLSLSLAIAVFSLGYVNPSFADNPRGGGHNHGGDDGGNGKDASYSVVISGAVLGVDGTDAWHGNFGGKSRIGLNIGGGEVGDGNNVGELTDLSFFKKSYPLGPWPGSRGEDCFSERAYLAQVILKVDKRGRAESRFWFTGLTKGSITVEYYLLIGVGEIGMDDVWPPSNITEMTLYTWEMKVDGESGPVRNASCVGDGDFANFESVEMFIKVELETVP